MDWQNATKKQLYQIATDDMTPLGLRYEAVRELQSRRFDSDMLPDLLRMWPRYTAEEIAEYLGIPISTIVGVASKYGLTRSVSA